MVHLTFMPIKRIMKWIRDETAAQRRKGKNGQGEKSQRRENISLDILLLQLHASHINTAVLWICAYDWVFDSRQNVVILCQFFIVLSSANLIAFIQLFYYAKAAKKISCYCPSGYSYSCVFHTFLSSALSTINPQWLTQQTQKAKDALLTPYPVSQLCLLYSILKNFSFSSHNVHKKNMKVRYWNVKIWNKTDVTGEVEKLNIKQKKKMKLAT